MEVNRSPLIKLAVAIVNEVINPLINNPEQIPLRMDVHTGHSPNTLDNGFGITTLLPMHPFYRRRGALVQMASSTITSPRYIGTP